METAIAAASHALDTQGHYYSHGHLEQLQQRSRPPSFDQHSLPYSFERQPQLASSYDSQPLSGAASEHLASGFEQPQPHPDLGHLGSPPRAGSDGLNGTIGSTIASPATRSAVGSPAPNPLSPRTALGSSRSSHHSSPPRNSGDLGHEFVANGVNGAATNGSRDGDSPGPVDQCKLVVLGLPWETTEDTLQVYFAQFGPLQEAVIMKDRYTGKSRGFGFVTYIHASDAARVVANEHNIDGRRCEAKFALPRGGANPNRTTRIFVARILPIVSDEMFRSHFEQYGEVQDAYMPKDASKMGHRGIGFVTFSSADAVERVMATTHVLAGQELAIDRATPKDRSPPPASTLLSGTTRQGQAALAGQVSAAFPYATGANPYGLAGSLGITPAALSAAAGAAALQGTGIGGAANDMQLATLLAANGLDLDSLLAANGLAANNNGLQVLQSMLGPDMGLGAAAMQPPSYGAPAPRGYRGTVDLPTSPTGGIELDGQRRASMDVSGRVNSPSQSGGTSAAMSHGGTGGSVTSGLDANSGPRIFVGKLNRATTEADVREYFTRFGYVMDVYMPRDKHNRHEHRGFGFVTFETEAAVHRVAAHGLHQIRGAAVAIDSAVPRREDTGPFAPSTDAGATYPGLAAAMNIIDLARGDAGPLRHGHAPGAARYRPYTHNGFEGLPGAY